MEDTATQTPLATARIRNFMGTAYLTGRGLVPGQTVLLAASDGTSRPVGVGRHVMSEDYGLHTWAIVEPGAADVRTAAPSPRCQACNDPIIGAGGPHHLCRECQADGW